MGLYSKQLEERYLKEYYDRKHSIAIEVRKTPKSDSLFKIQPKIPKSGKSLYRGLYLRKLGGLNYIYDIENVLFVAVIDGECCPKEWIDKKYSEIRRRIDNVSTFLGV